jgi:hypothetical protein
MPRDGSTSVSHSECNFQELLRRRQRGPRPKRESLESAVGPRSLVRKKQPDLLQVRKKPIYAGTVKHFQHVLFQARTELTEEGKQKRRKSLLGRTHALGGR